MSSPVDWKFAAKVAKRVAGNDPYALSYHSDSLPPDFVEFTAVAEELVASATGLVSNAGPARSRVTDRAGWVDANIASFQRLLRPLTEKLNPQLSDGPLSPMTRRFAGLEVGLLLGWMSTRVLGQYDLLIIEDEHPDEQDLVYYVGPNILALEKRFGFPPREFRLWLALHEVTHRAQFTGIPWMRPHFLSLVQRTIDGVSPDPARFIEALKRGFEDLRSKKSPLAEGGLAALLASPEQREVLDQIGGLMSLLEGHGDVTMDRAGADRIPSADRFAQVLRSRRQQGGALGRLLQRLIGLEAKLNQYQQGEEFIEIIEKTGGPDLLNSVWEAPQNLPSLAEIREPKRWLDRIQSQTVHSTSFL